MSIAKDLLSEIEDFMSRFDMAATTFGRKAMSDPHIVRRLRDGYGISSQRIDKLREFMASYASQSQARWPRKAARKPRRPRARPKRAKAGERSRAAA